MDVKWTKYKVNLSKTASVERRQMIERHRKNWKHECRAETDLRIWKKHQKASGLSTAVRLYIRGNRHSVHLWPPPPSPASGSGLSSGCGEDGATLSDNLRQGFLFALHRAEEEALHRHEALADQALGAAGAFEALWLGVPVVLAVGNPLGLGLNRILAGGTFLGGRIL